MKIVSQEAGFKLELTIPDNLKKNGLSDDDANKLINFFYKRFIDKILFFIAYAIGSQDIESLENLADILANIAKDKLDNE